MIRSLLLLTTIVGLVLFGPLFIHIDPLATHPDMQLQAPDGDHLLGTDLLGRDVFSRVLYGGRSTLWVATLATLCASALGFPLGLVGGFLKSDFDLVLINVLLAVPGLVIALVMLTLMGHGVGSLVIALGVSQIAPLAFVMRSAVRLARAKDYVDATRGLGASESYILMRHIIPATLPTVLAYLGVIFSYALLNGAALSFLGLGNEPGTPDWGVMLAEGRAAFRTAPWVGLAPGVAITIIVWCINDLADQLTRIR